MRIARRLSSDLVCCCDDACDDFAWLHVEINHSRLTTARTPSNPRRAGSEGSFEIVLLSEEVISHNFDSARCVDDDGPVFAYLAYMLGYCCFLSHIICFGIVVEVEIRKRTEKRPRN